MPILEDKPANWWRCEVVRSALWDYDYETVTGYRYSTKFREFEVLKETPQGVRVKEIPFGSVSFVKGTASKQLCVPTKELALRDAKIRADRHIAGCEARLKIALRQRAELGFLGHEMEKENT